MDFKEATDFLFERVDHGRLARELGVSVAAVRQARLKPTAGAHRSPPPHWQKGIAALAADQVERYRLLLERLNTSTSSVGNRSRHEGDNGVDMSEKPTH